MNAGLLIIRLVIGLLMAAHGCRKLFGWFGGNGLAGGVTVLAGKLAAVLVNLPVGREDVDHPDFGVPRVARVVVRIVRRRDFDAAGAEFVCPGCRISF